ncbi:conserved hypothetical protein [Hyella patelloides LEGE 07179]|uniref:Rho termination factor-like N-terminal domain-containing protein n=1 Tax=Hyella patelloides LEGE 07179 TaxID=945734 RepID=A0A563VZR3_9CYAN|nr:DUF4912 domain-containing protein [Hyella patelloides]VEP16857.1 conserved hypothetical protein [Hyella patelloides LEGE 07179]
MVQNRPLEEMTLRQLRKVASELKISKYSRMRKAQLKAAIQAKIVNRENEQLEQNSLPVQEEQQVEATKFEVGQKASIEDAFSDIDQDLGELPSGYGESRIVLMPRDPQWSYCYWDISNEHKEELRRQGGQQLALRIYDISDIDLNSQAPHNVQEYLCDEMAREWYVPVPVSDRDYMVDIGYRCADGRWLILARSASVRIPPVYPSEWVEDNFVKVDWEQNLRGETVVNLVPPNKKQEVAATHHQSNPIYDQIFGMAESVEAMRIAGSLFGSMQQAPEQAVSSYIFPSGVGMWALPTASGISMSGVGMNMSGAGFASAPPARPRKFWLVADAELIVYGATEPDATVTVGGRPIKLNPDGTFRFQMSFQDGVIDYPIVAVAADGEQTRSVHMNFERQTPSRNTNTKEEAVEEWFA